MRERARLRRTLSIPIDLRERRRRLLLQGVDRTCTRKSGFRICL